MWFELFVLNEKNASNKRVYMVTKIKELETWFNTTQPTTFATFDPGGFVQRLGHYKTCPTAKISLTYIVKH